MGMRIGKLDDGNSSNIVTRASDAFGTTATTTSFFSFIRSKQVQYGEEGRYRKGILIYLFLLGNCEEVE